MVCEVKDYADREVELLPQQVEMVDDEGELVGAVSFARSAQTTNKKKSSGKVVSEVST